MSESITFFELIEELEQLYPTQLAEEWDQVGIHFGYGLNQCKRIMTALDIRPEVIQEAIENNIDTIIVHHPPIFVPIQRFDNSTADLIMYHQIIKNDINVFAMHTNLDKAQNGMNDWLAQALELKNITELHESEEGMTGLGRIGELDTPLNRNELFEYIKSHLHAERLTIIEKVIKNNYQRIAIVGGSSFESIDIALSKEADVFITGDITYHKGHDAYEKDILTIDAGHYIERIFSPKMKEVIDDLADSQDWDIQVVESKTNTNPFTYI